MQTSRLSPTTLIILRISQEGISKLPISLDCDLATSQPLFSVGIGSDYDGISETPEGLEDTSKYPALVNCVSQRFVIVDERILESSDR